MREQTDVKALEEIMHKLLPHMRANCRLLDRLPVSTRKGIVALAPAACPEPR